MRPGVPFQKAEGLAVDAADILFVLFAELVDKKGGQRRDVLFSVLADFSSSSHLHKISYTPSKNSMQALCCISVIIVDDTTQNISTTNRASSMTTR